MHLIKATSLALALGCALAGCSRDTASEPAAPAAAAAPASAGYFGTLEPFAANAVYFVVTDRFVNGDTGNDQREQGGANRTFDIALPACDGVAGNIGYLGGDFKGIADNLDYIHGMGFGAVWITPIVDNPDEAFTGGNPPGCSSILSDKGKTGYHGYWGINFYTLDEHLPSPGLDFRGLADAVHAKDMKLVLDIVGNHGSPGWTMPKPQPQFGQLFAKDGTLIADHQNLPPQQLDPANNPLHRFFNTTGPVDGEKGSIFDGNLAQLSDLDPNNPAVLDYLAAGLDPQRTTIFAHSAVPALNQLLLPFLSLVTEAELHRNPTVKAELEATDGRAMSGLLLTYPVHQAADILFCQANLVPVGKDQVQHIDVQVAQAAVDPGFEILRAVAGHGLLRQPATGLGRHERARAAPLLEHARDQLLGMSVAVNVRGVDEVQAGVERGMQRGHRFGIVDLAPRRADRPSAEADRGHAAAGAAERSVAHVRLLSLLLPAVVPDRARRRGHSHSIVAGGLPLMS